MKYSVRFIAVGVLLGVLGLGLWPSFVGAQQPSPAGTVPPGIIVKPPGESELQVELQVRRGEYGVGEPVERDEFIRLKLNKQAFVYLLLITPEKEVTVPGATVRVREVRLLFPNQFVPRNFLLAEEYTFPGPGLLDGIFEIPGPGGIAYVQAIATPVSIGLEPETFEEPFPILGSAPDLIKEDIQRRIQQKGLKPADWVASWTQYQVLTVMPFALRTPPPGELCVKVLNKDTRQPLAEALVFVDGQLRGITNAAGEVCIFPLAPNDYRVRVERRGYQSDERLSTVKTEKTTNEEFPLIPLPRQAALRASRTRALIYTEPVEFDASESSGPILLYEWDFQSDGIIDKRTLEPKVLHTFTEAGPHKVTVIVVFEDAETDFDSVKVVIDGPPMLPGLAEPGSVFIEPEPRSSGLVINPITLQLTTGGVVFVAINSAYPDRHGQFLVKRDPITGKWLPATLSFDYSYKSLPELEKATVQSLVRVIFFNAARECLGDKDPKTQRCLGKAENRYFTLDTTVPGAQLPPLNTWHSKELGLTFPDEAVYVMVTIELLVPVNNSGKSIIVEYRNIALKS